MDRPSALSCWIRCPNSRTNRRARPSDGSSRRRKCGLPIRALAEANICCSPPERARPGCSRRSRRRGNLHSLSMTSAVTALPSGRANAGAWREHSPLLPLHVGDLCLVECPSDIVCHGLDIRTHRVADVAREVDTYHTGLLNHQKVEVFGALNPFPKSAGWDSPQRVEPCHWLECKLHAMSCQEFYEQMQARAVHVSVVRNARLVMLKGRHHPSCHRGHKPRISLALDHFQIADKIRRADHGTDMPPGTVANQFCGGEGFGPGQLGVVDGHLR